LKMPNASLNRHKLAVNKQQLFVDLRYIVYY